MKATRPARTGNLKFLEQHRVEDECISLPSGVQVSIPKYFLTFKPWDGKELEFDYGGKPILDSDGEACFAELAILRLFLNRGWNGAWIETYGGMHFLNSMPRGWSLKSEHISIPAGKEALIRKIWEAGKTRACFDVVVWHGGKTLFCEAKRLKKDRLTEAQQRFIQGALACGISASTLLIIEWDFDSVPKGQ